MGVNQGWFTPISIPFYVTCNIIYTFVLKILIIHLISTCMEHFSYKNLKSQADLLFRPYGGKNFLFFG